MSDEESFVILGSTPTPSMEAYSSFNDTVSANQSKSSGESANTVFKITSSLCSDASWLASDGGSLKACEKKTSDDAKAESMIEISPISTLNSNMNKLVASGSASLNGGAIQCESSLPESIADKYLLGKVGEKEMQMYFSSKFPSLLNKDSQQDDVQNLQQLIIDHETSKNQLLKMNKKLEHLIDVIQVGNETMQSRHQREIDKLRNENIALRQEFESRVEAIKLNEENLQKDHLNLTQKVSEGKSVISNITAQLEKLELQQHDISIININDNQVPERQILSQEETTKQIKNLEEELSELKAENLEFLDMKTVYTDEINCLKVNLTAAEELLKKTQADINLLKSKDIEKNELFQKYEEEKNKMKQEIEILKQQLEIYRSDFEMERTARQELAGQKDQLVTDLKLLQRRNQQLIEENERRTQNVAPMYGTLTVSQHQPPPPPRENVPSNQFTCPICYKVFRSLQPLQDHVESCLT